MRNPRGAESSAGAMTQLARQEVRPDDDRDTEGDHRPESDASEGDPSQVRPDVGAARGRCLDRELGERRLPHQSKRRVLVEGDPRRRAHFAQGNGCRGGRGRRGSGCLERQALGGRRCHVNRRCRPLPDGAQRLRDRRLRERRGLGHRERLRFLGLRGADARRGVRRGGRDLEEANRPLQRLLRSDQVRPDL